MAMHLMSALTTKFLEEYRPYLTKTMRKGDSVGHFSRIGGKVIAAPQRRRHAPAPSGRGWPARVFRRKIRSMSAPLPFRWRVPGRRVGPCSVNDWWDLLSQPAGCRCSKLVA
jgi:hypothetical protein